VRLAERAKSGEVGAHNTLPSLSNSVASDSELVTTAGRLPRRSVRGKSKSEPCSASVNGCSRRRTARPASKLVRAA
jgi:hypothetical protein